MSQKRHSMLQHRLAGVKVQAGGFICDTSDPTTLYGDGFTVNVGTGNYNVVFDGPYRKILAVVANVGGAAVPAFPTCEGYLEGATQAAQFTVNVFLQDGATKAFATDTPAAVDEVRVDFVVFFLDIGAQ